MKVWERFLQQQNIISTNYVHFKTKILLRLFSFCLCQSFKVRFHFLPLCHLLKSMLFRSTFMIIIISWYSWNWQNKSSVTVMSRILVTKNLKNCAVYWNCFCKVKQKCKLKIYEPSTSHHSIQAECKLDCYEKMFISAFYHFR